jgi:hypothetical protein
MEPAGIRRITGITNDDGRNNIHVLIIKLPTKIDIGQRIKWSVIVLDCFSIEKPVIAVNVISNIEIPISVADIVLKRIGL